MIEKREGKDENGLSQGQNKNKKISGPMANQTWPL